MEWNHYSIALGNTQRLASKKTKAPRFISETGGEQVETDEAKNEMTLDCFIFAIYVFVRDFNQSAIKGHFCAFLVSSIFLTSLSTDLTSHFSDQPLLVVRLLIPFSLHRFGKQCLQRFVRNPSMNPELHPSR